MNSDPVLVSWELMNQAISENPNKHVRPSTIPASDELSEDPSTMITDPISLSLWIRDPLFRIANASIRNSMKFEETTFLIESTDSAWATHGKIRGWVRKHLEEDLRSPTLFSCNWDTIRTSKRAALLLDYICFIRDFRVALWFDKVVTVIPFSVSNTKITHVDCVSSTITIGPHPNFFDEGIQWVPPACAPSIGTQTVAQVTASAELLGPDPDLKTESKKELWFIYLRRLFQRSIASDGLAGS
jgi:hypothetical protein